MSEILKFRFWNGEKLFIYDLFNIPQGISYINAPMQFTGLLDKNGKEIYCGDIVCWKYDGRKPKEKVIFGNGIFGVMTTVGIVAVDEYLHQELEVIGNIYENLNSN